MRSALVLLGAFFVGCNPAGSTASHSSGGAGAPPTASSAPPAASVSAAASVAPTPTAARSDTIPTSAGALTVTPLHHASLLLGFGGKTIAVDPTNEGNANPARAGAQADYVFLTHTHPDHFVPAAIDAISKPGAVTVGPPSVSAERPMSVVLKNGESHDFGAFKVEAVPMYNLSRGPAPGKLFHDKGGGDGYVFTFGDTRVYVSGDTECTPEMKALHDIKVAFLCMNLPYTMPVEEAAACARAMKPKIVYPYHYRGQDPKAFAAGLEGSGIEVRVRDWYGAP